MFPASGMAMAGSTSPGQSSPESLEVEDDSNHTSSQWQSHDNSNISPDDNAASASQQQQQLPRPTAPMQKRRRVTRACDECRRKKIKCDGKQPCTHCTVYSYGRPYLHNTVVMLCPGANVEKIALMISPQTDEGILRHIILRRWRTVCNVPKRSCETSFPILT